MSEWWTYRLSNFLLFSPRTYQRLFELYNAAIWPAQAAALLLGLFLLFCLLRPTPARVRLLVGLLAACWIWVAIAFHAKRYATINWAAAQFAWSFGVEAALLLWHGLLRRFPNPRHPEESEATEGPAALSRATAIAPRSPVAATAGLWFFAYALFLHPFAAFLSGRSWRGIEIFGVTPDPTALATIGVVLAAARRPRWFLLVIPVLWCVISGFTLRAMNAPDGWILFAAAAAAVVFAWRGRVSTSRANLGE